MKYFILIFTLLFCLNGFTKIIDMKKDEVTKITATDKAMVIVLYTTWCGYCKKLLKQLKPISEDKKYSKVTFIKVDAEKEQIPTNGVPTTIIRKNNKGVIFTGAPPNTTALRQAIDDAFKKLDEEEPDIIKQFKRKKGG